MIKLFFNIFLRDILLGLGSGGNTAMQITFLLVVASLFSFALGAEQTILAQVAAAIIWVSLLLSSLLSLQNLFESDDEDGSLQLLWMQGLAPEMLTLAKILAHTCSILLPMLIATPILSTMLYMPSDSLFLMLKCLPLVALLLSLIGALGASLTLGVRRATGLLSVLVLPFYIPILIFAVSSISSTDTDTQNEAFILLLASCTPRISSRKNSCIQRPAWAVIISCGSSS